MSKPMPDWLSHPQTSYVLAAYGVASAALFGLLVFSFCAARRREREWRQLQDKRAKDK